MSCELLVRFRRVGFHCWPDAPEPRDYLRARHRHVFHVEVRMPVAGGDARELEYHDVLEKAQVLWRGMGLELGAASCESLAQTIADGMAAWGQRPATCSVLEDGECGATATSTRAGAALSRPKHA